MRKPTRARYEAQLAQQKARVAQLEAALAPFASTARALTWPIYDGQPIITARFVGDVRIGTTWADWKRAAALLPEAQPQQVIHGFLAPDGRIVGAPIETGAS